MVDDDDNDDDGDNDGFWLVVAFGAGVIHEVAQNNRMRVKSTNTRCLPARLLLYPVSALIKGEMPRGRRGHFRLVLIGWRGIERLGLPKVDTALSCNQRPDEFLTTNKRM